MIYTNPPPMVIILASAAIKSSAEWSIPASPTPCCIPTQGYLALSGYKLNKKVSPVPKYAWRLPLSSFKLRSHHRVEQYAPNTWRKNFKKNNSSFVDLKLKDKIIWTVIHFQQFEYFVQHFFWKECYLVLQLLTSFRVNFLHLFFNFENFYQCLENFS